MGACKVGKTAICQVLCGKRFPVEYQPTLCVDLNTYTLPPDPASASASASTFYIWELSGADKYRSLITPYMNRSEVGIFVYDITDVSSLSKLDYYIKVFKGPTRILVANKCDGGDSSEGKAYADRNGMSYFKTSAKNNIGIKELFQYIAEQGSSDPHGSSIWLTGQLLSPSSCC